MIIAAVVEVKIRVVVVRVSVAFVVLFAICLSARSSAGSAHAFLSQEWDDRFFAPTSPIIRHLAADNFGNVYVAGAFKQISGIVAGGIARWDGSRWSALGAEEIAVGEMVVSPNGKLYVASNRVLEWGGERWSSLGESFDPGVNDLAVDQEGNVFAHGCFSHPRFGTRATGIVRWDGTRWIRLPGAPDCIGGLLKSAIGLHAYWNDGIYAWKEESAEWIRVAGLPSPEWRFTGLLVDKNGTIYGITRGYSYIEEEIVLSGGVIRWDGNDWKLLEGMEEGVFFGQMAIDPHGVFVVAAHGKDRISIRRWNGNVMETLDKSLIPGSHSVSLAVTPGGVLFAGGGFTHEEGSLSNFAAWTGDRWLNPVETGEGANAAVVEPSPTTKAIST